MRVGLVRVIMMMKMMIQNKFFSDNNVVMLSSLVKEHQVRQGAKKEVQEARKQEALTAANKLTEVTVTSKDF